MVSDVETMVMLGPLFLVVTRHEQDYQAATLGTNILSEWTDRRTWPEVMAYAQMPRDTDAQVPSRHTQTVRHMMDAKKRGYIGT